MLKGNGKKTCFDKLNDVKTNFNLLTGNCVLILNIMSLKSTVSFSWQNFFCINGKIMVEMSIYIDFIIVL